jgi:hypothetical protein
LNPDESEFHQIFFWNPATDSILVELTVFETSEGTPHLWMPEAGDYRVLHKQEIWLLPDK